MAMTKPAWLAHHKKAGTKPTGTYAQYVKKHPAPPPPNRRPEGWALEGRQVTPGNRHLYPTSGFEIAPGAGGTSWARPRTEMTGIDPELRGLVKTFDTKTTANTDHIKRVYDALGAQLTTDASASQARLGGLADLAGRAAPMLFQSAPVTAPGGGGAIVGGVPATAGVDVDAQATRQRQLLREAALNVNTANLDAQQAPQIGAQQIAQFTGERSSTRDEMLKALLFQTRQDALEARGQRLDFLSKQAGLESDQSIAGTKAASEAQRLQQQRDLEVMREGGRNNRAVVTAGAASGKASAAAKAKQAADYKKLLAAFGKDVFGLVGGRPAELDPATKTEVKAAVPGVTVAEAFSRAIARGLTPRDALRMVRLTTQGSTFLSDRTSDRVGNPDLNEVLRVLEAKYGAKRAEQIAARVFGIKFGGRYGVGDTRPG